MKDKAKEYSIDDTPFDVEIHQLKSLLKMELVSQDIVQAVEA